MPAAVAAKVTICPTYLTLTMCARKRALPPMNDATCVRISCPQLLKRSEVATAIIPRERRLRDNSLTALSCSLLIRMTEGFVDSDSKHDLIICVLWDRSLGLHFLGRSCDLSRM